MKTWAIGIIFALSAFAIGVTVLMALICQMAIRYGVLQ